MFSTRPRCTPLSQGTVFTFTSQAENTEAFKFSVTVYATRSQCTPTDHNVQVLPGHTVHHYFTMYTVTQVTNTVLVVLCTRMGCGPKYSL